MVIPTLFWGIKTLFLVIPTLFWGKIKVGITKIKVGITKNKV
jgi:hypothetical protein